ncbi:hypothetical protein [Methylobacterium sp. 275MFSha3.1]|uniref:hypothetical protein n=1 Tax=Methylobacterium sp. 275MFSha3.1 TaxID=1502746 RepID=UPI000AA11290|nr:hypothetical protein [Methylobacterium sp. 275MFSha3.1]
MAGDDTLAKALADVRQRRADLQSDYERIVTELTKLRTAEKSLAAIVEGGPGAEVDFDTDFAAMEERPGSPKRGRGRGSRGPRANSAKGRLKALLEQTGPQGLSHAELERRLPDVAPNTLNTYLSMMVTGGEAVRRGDFYVAAAPAQHDEAAPEAAADVTDHGAQSEATD